MALLGRRQPGRARRERERPLIYFASSTLTRHVIKAVGSLTDDDAVESTGGRPQSRLGRLTR